MGVITCEMLKGATKGQTVAGLLLCRSYSIALTKAGKEYIQGTMQSEVEMPFKAWGNSEAFVSLKNNDYVGQVCNIQGHFDDYGGSFSLIIEDINAVADIDISQFLANKYDVEGYWKNLISLVQQNVSAKAFEIAKQNLFENPNVIDDFKNEFAASSHHDNCRGGLLAHTYKVVYYVLSSLVMYPTLISSADEKDILILGALFHDIGKIKEMKLGTYQACSKVTHRYIGIEMIDKSSFVEAYGEDGWLELVAIFLQHHGDYEDKCRTVLAYIVHKADCFDADMTYLIQAKEKPSVRNGVNNIKIDTSWLSMM